MKFALHEAKVAQRKVKFEFIVDVARREAKSYSVAVPLINSLVELSLVPKEKLSYQKASLSL